MRGLSIRQPWVWAITHAGKDIENRSWDASFRGRFFIHASLRRPTPEDMEDFDDVLRLARPPGAHLARPPFGLRRGRPPGEDVHYGKIVGVATVVGCVERSASPWFFGPYGFMLEDVRAFETPVECKGALGFFRVPPPALLQCRHQMERIGC